jgi:hypothetical protein
MYQYLLFLALLSIFLFIVYKNYNIINNYVNKTVFYSQNIQEIKNKMASLDNPKSI